MRQNALVPRPSSFTIGIVLWPVLCIKDVGTSRVGYHDSGPDPAIVTEEQLENAATNANHLPATTPNALPDDAPPIPTEGARQNEELRMLFMGFGTGLLIAGVFLVYIVFAYANWLP